VVDASFITLSIVCCDASLSRIVITCSIVFIFISKSPSIILQIPAANYRSTVIPMSRNRICTSAVPTMSIISIISIIAKYAEVACIINPNTRYIFHFFAMHRKIHSNTSCNTRDHTPRVRYIWAQNYGIRICTFVRYGITFRKPVFCEILNRIQ